jgi:hypothetical protein
MTIKACDQVALHILGDIQLMSSVAPTRRVQCGQRSAKATKVTFAAPKASVSGFILCKRRLSGTRTNTQTTRWPTSHLAGDVS